MSTNKPSKLSQSDKAYLESGAVDFIYIHEVKGQDETIYCYGSIDETSNFSIVGQFDGEAVWTSGIQTKTGREIESPSWPTVCKFFLDRFESIGQIEAV